MFTRLHRGKGTRHQSRSLHLDTGKETNYSWSWQRNIIHTVNCGIAVGWIWSSDALIKFTNSAEVIHYFWWIVCWWRSQDRNSTSGLNWYAVWFDKNLSVRNRKTKTESQIILNMKLKCILSIKLLLILPDHWTITSGSSSTTDTSSIIQENIQLLQLCPDVSMHYIP